MDRNIEFLPFQNVEEIIKEIDKSNLVIVPSIDTGYEYEAGPLTIMESMARRRLALVIVLVLFHTLMSQLRLYLNLEINNL